MHDQAAKLRELVRATVGADPALRPGPPIVVVSGAAPDVDAASVVSDAAAELARLGKRVAIVDANPDQPRQADLAGVAADDALANVLSGARRAVEELTRLNEHVELLASRSGASPPQLSGEALSRLLAEIASLGSRVDVIVIDAGAGMTPWVERLWRHAQQVLLICTDQAPSITAAYSAVKMAHSPALEGKLRLAVRCANEATAAAVADRFADTCQRFLALAPKEPVWIAADSQRPASLGDDAPNVESDAGVDQRYRRCLRLLAAELAADVRAIALRMIDSNARNNVGATGDDPASADLLRLDATPHVRATIPHETPHLSRDDAARPALSEAD